jgi:hypothetical protein
MTSVTAVGSVHAAPAAVFAFLSDLRNHWRLTGRWIRLEGLDGPSHGPTGGTVIVRGPLGLHRRVQTSVVEATPDRALRGRAAVGRRTEAEVHWRIEPDGSGGARVTLRADVVRAGRLDRLLLRLGAAWLRRRFADTITQLDLAMSGGRAPQRVLANLQASC